jgi:hypothetical protein
MIEFVDQKVILNIDEYLPLMLNEKLILMKLKIFLNIFIYLII